MKPKTLALMVVAVGCGLAASYMTSRLLAERGQQAETPTVKVLVAKAKVPMWTKIKEPEKFFEVRDVPESSMTKKALTTFEEIKDRCLNRTLPEDGMATKDDLLSKDQDPISSQLLPGQRATALRVNAESLAGGFVLPGSRVDVVATMRRGDESISQLVLQDVLVLAVDTKTNRAADENSIIGQTVTVAAKPEDAMKLSLSAAIGELRLVLRAAGDTEKLQIKATKVADLGKQTDGSASGQQPEDTPGGTNPLVVLPKLPPVPDAPKVEEPAEPVKPVVKHTLTIVNNGLPSRHVFVQNDEGEWDLNGLNRSDLESPRSAKKPYGPSPAPPAPPAPDAPEGR